MNIKSYTVENLGSQLQLSLYGFTVEDVFYNSFIAFKRLTWQNQYNRSDLINLQLPMLSYSIHIESDSTETMFEKWFSRLVSYTDSMKYLPVSLDMMYLHDNVMRTQITYRMMCKKDRCKYHIRGIESNSVRIETTNVGLKLQARVNI